MKTPSLSYTEILRALQRGGWVVIRQEGSHIRLRKRLPEETLNLTLPAHKPVKRSTLDHISKQARLTTEEFLDLL